LFAFAYYRLYKRCKEGGESDRVKVSEVRDIFHAFDDSLSMQECGYIVRQAFPGLQRRRIHSVWYYYGLSFRDSNASRHIMNNSSKTKESLDKLQSRRLALQGEKRKITHRIYQYRTEKGLKWMRKTS
jgi:hypothetical protein